MQENEQSIGAISAEHNGIRRNCRQLIQRSLDPMFAVEMAADGCMRLSDANPAWLRLMGVAVVPQDGLLFEERIRCEPPVRFIAGIRQCFAKGNSAVIPCRLPTSQGVRHLQTTLTPLSDPDGHVEQVLGVTRDLSRGFAIENALQRLNRELHAISDCNQALMRAEDEDSLLHDICRIICRDAGYRMAWVGFADNDQARTIRPVAWAGAESGYLQQAGLTWADSARGRGASGSAVRSGEFIVIQDFLNDPRAAPWRDQALARGYRSSIALPLMDERHNSFGVLNIYATEPFAFTAGESSMLQALADDLAFGVMVLRGREERKRAEVLRRSNLFFFQNMDRVNRAIQGARELEQMMSDVLDQVLEIFACDRAYLLHPCDPDAAVWTVPMERTRPEYPGIRELGLKMPMKPAIAKSMRLALNADGPLQFGEGAERPISREIVRLFSLKNFMSMAIRPKVGEPWEFGIQQCAHARSWNADEERLFREIGLRLTDSLTSMLIFQNLQTSEQKLKQAERSFHTLVDNLPDCIARFDRDVRPVLVNRAVEVTLGHTMDEVMAHGVAVLGPGSEAENAMLERMVRRVFETGAANSVESRWQTLDGVRYFDVTHLPERDASGQVVSVLGIGHDITDAKLAEQALRRLNRELRAVSLCHQILIRAEDEQSLLAEICRIVCEEAGYRMAWVGYAGQGASREIRPLAWAGCEEGYLSEVRLSWDDDSWGGSPAGRAMRSGMTAFNQEFASGQAAGPWLDSAVRHGFLSSIALPLRDQQASVFGVLAIYSGEAHAFNDDEIRLLEELAADLAFGIGVLRARLLLKQSELDLQSANGILRALIESAPVAIFGLDLQGRVHTVWNPAAERIFGWRAEEVMGKFLPMVREENLPEFQRLCDIMRDGGVIEGRELRWHRRDGSFVDCNLYASPLHDADANISGIIAVLVDITELKRQREQLIYQAHYDSLTGLPNRFLAMDRLDRHIRESRRSGRPTALLFLDLDDFKKVNDTLGHEVGDQVLVSAAGRLTAVVRDADTVGRLGGDEFVVLIHDISGADDVCPVAEKILQAFQEVFPVMGRQVTLTASLGIAIYPDDGEDPMVLLRNADIAMYHSKAMGRNAYHFFTESMNQDVARRMQLEEQLRLALGQDEFHLVYQPIVDVASGRVDKAEVLLRWRNSLLGDVMPDEFIDVAEQTGLIIGIGEWVARTALRQLAAWRERAGRAFKLALNVSPRQFRQEGFVDMLQRCLGESGLRGEDIELEITEGVLMSGEVGIAQVLDQLRRIGVYITMDDFGTGYSSLNYLRNYRFYALKIDRSFIRDITTDPRDRELILATLRMAKSLGVRVVAEGVETVEQLAFLRREACDFAQGYYLSEPIDAQPMGEIIESDAPLGAIVPG